MTNKQVDILHLSYRVRGICNVELQTSMEARVNIILRVLDNDSFIKQRFDYESSEIQTIKTLSSVEEYQQYLEEIDKIEDICEWVNENKTFDKVFKTSYKLNDMPLLTYIPKFDVYRFHEWIDWTPSTQAIIRELELLRHGDNWSSTTEEFHILRCLRALDIFWS